ncbi:MAG: hypothetical protein QOF37_78, partial [Thermoleophilaceae bacterium]|nr:hypothetical protein [Thermoleophilaceae bacterium]
DARLSRYSYLVSLLPGFIARDLVPGVTLARRSVSSYTPRPDGTGLLVRDGEPPHDAWRDFYAMTSRVGRRVFPTLTQPLPSRDALKREISEDEAWEALFERPLGETVAERFPDDLEQGVVLTDGLIGTFATAGEPSLRQNRCFLYHVIGRGDGRWRVPVGGMGAVTRALERSARAAGAEIRTSAAAQAIEHGPQTSQVRFEGGQASARWILAGVAPHTLARLENTANGRRPDPAAEGSQLKVNMLLDRLPRLRSQVPAEDAFAGTFRLNEHEDEIAAAYAAAAAGELPARPPAELYCHSLTDRSTLGPDAPPELNSLTLFGLHTPASLFRDDEDGTRDTLVERYLDALDEHLEDPIRDCLARDGNGELCIEAKTPLDLERELGMPGGNIFHGDLSWPWAGEGEPGGAWGVETEHPRTFLCGAGARRGGGVSCIGGQNAAMAVLAGGRRRFGREVISVPWDASTTA